MKTLNMRDAINEALVEEMEKDKTTVYFGEDVAKMGGINATTKGLLEQFGAERVFDTPIAEATIAGAAAGMAASGLRPITEYQFADFIAIAFDEIFNKFGKWRYMHGGKIDMPITMRLPIGAVGGAGPEHSQSPQSLLMHSQGIYVAIPSNPNDAKGLLKTAIRNQNPVLVFEHKLLYDIEGEVEEGDYTIPLGEANIVKEGTDITVLATSYEVQKVKKVADELEKEGISIELIDPRTIIPLDKDAILESIKKTGRFIIVHEEPKTGGTGAEIAAFVAEEALFNLRAPVKRIAGPDVPIAQNIELEKYYRPSEEQIIKVAKELMEY